MIEQPDIVAALKGRAFVPSSDGYDAARRGMGLNDMPSPALIVMAERDDDVIAAVLHARSNNLPVQVMATGHNFGAAHKDGVLINTSNLRGVEIDPARRTAKILAGTPWREVIAAAQPHGLAPLSGSAPTVGAVGYTLFGGIGSMVRKYGAAVDSVRGFDIVLANGRLHLVDAESDPDLFWALRGGGGNFGVVTAMEIELYPHPTVFAGNIVFPLERAEEVLNAYSAWAATMPDEMTTATQLLRLPPLPFLPEPLRGKNIILVRGIYLGDEAEGTKLIEPIRALGGAVMDTFTTLPYAELPRVYQDPDQPGRFWRSSGLLKDLGPQTVADVLAVVGPASQSPLMVFEIRQLGGQLARVATDATAFSQRTAPFTYNAIGISFGMPNEPTEYIAGYPNVVREALAVHTAGILPGWLGDGMYGVDQTRGGYTPENYARLAALKAKYDPTNMFRLTHNITPAE